MTREFKNKQRSTGMKTDLRHAAVNAATGIGTFTVEVDFLPDFLSARFATQGTQGKQHDGRAAAGDYIYWELKYVRPQPPRLVDAIPALYEARFYYKCEYTRDIQWVIAKLPKDAELLAH